MTISQVFGHAVSAVVSPIIECVDVDGVVRRVDVNDVVSRIDLDQVVDRIDINRLLDRIDWDRHLQRVNLEAAMNRIDVEKLVLRSNVGAIVTQSTTGIFTQLLDSIRIQVVVVDLYFFRLSRSCRKYTAMLPQKPGGSHEDNHTWVPEKRIDKAIAVQGRYTGFFAKTLAMFIDVSFLTLSFAMLLALFAFSRWIFDFGWIESPTKYEVDRGNLVVGICYCFYGFLYFFLGVLLTGQTLGNAIVGVTTVNSRDGTEVTTCQALVRTIILPVSLVILPLFFFVGACRRDGRMLHDLISGTGMIYKWNARLSKLREVTRARMEQEMFTSSHGSASDSMELPMFSSARIPMLSQSQSSEGSYTTARTKEVQQNQAS
jgi:uncharacterized RDD family membrane protein YckC